MRVLNYVALPFCGLSMVQDTSDLILDTDSKMLDGWVYILSNELMPGIYKVGMTTIDPVVRAKEISRGTGVPGPFKVEKSFHVKNPAAAEKYVHQDLAKYRVNDNREFFKCSIDEICDSICEVGAWETGTCSEDILVNKKFITTDRYSGQSKTLKITPELYDRLTEESFGDTNAIAEGLLTMVVEQLNCSVLFDGRSAIAFTSPVHPPKTPEIEISPRLISTREIKGFTL